MSDLTTPRFWTWAALAVSGTAVAGSLYLSLGLSLLACPLCYYQRAFAMAVFGVLAMSLLSRAQARVPPTVLAMPMALAGLFIATWHTYLVISGKLECPTGLLGLGTAPQQSLLVFVLIVLTLAWDTGSFANRREEHPEPGQAPPPPGRILLIALGPILLGLFFAVSSVLAVPPPKAPDKPYDASKPIDTCRIPYKSTS